MAEHIYSQGTQVWMPDPAELWLPGEVHSSTNGSGGTIKLVFAMEGRDEKVVLETTPKEIESGSQKLPPLRNPPHVEVSKDLSNLAHLNEPSVLHTIRLRYSEHKIYTYSGIVLIAVNPFANVKVYGPEIMQQYVDGDREQLDPHLFAIAEDAYATMRTDGRAQTIIVSGESGAGKTESAKYIMRFLASIDPVAQQRATYRTVDDSSPIERQILATNPILEAFGNAKTIRNDNSSRFGKYIQILFDEKPKIIGACIRTYLLERSRVVAQQSSERNYHVFYQLCMGTSPEERAELGLENAERFSYLNPTSVDVANANDGVNFRGTRRALSTIGIAPQRQWIIFQILAAILHIGNISITQRREGAVIDSDDASLVRAASLLEVDAFALRKWTTHKQIATRSEAIATSLNASQAIVVRDGLAKFIYAALFEWLVDIVNQSLSGAGKDAQSFIGVLDIYGFEHLQKNSFEQFCINYANEKLQQQYTSYVFKLEQAEYSKEKIDWTFIDFSDNQPCIDLIEGKLGILALMDEESRLIGGTDVSFVQKLNAQLLKPENARTFKRHFQGNLAFAVAHYANDVTYDADGFLEKNRGAMPDEYISLLTSTKSTMLREVIDVELRSMTSPHADSPDVNSNTSPIPDTRSAISNSAGKRGFSRKPTQCSIFKLSLATLMESLYKTHIHYIRCIKPNEYKKAWEFDSSLVLGQLRACGVLETIKISCAGYPSRMTYEEFADRYYMLIPFVQRRHLMKDNRRLCSTVLRTVVDDQSKFQYGQTKIFFRIRVLAVLEGVRTQRLNTFVTALQKHVRRRQAVRRYQEIRHAVIDIQAACRRVLAYHLLVRMRIENAMKKTSPARNTKKQTILKRTSRLIPRIDIPTSMIPKPATKSAGSSPQEQIPFPKLFPSSPPRQHHPPPPASSQPTSPVKSRLKKLGSSVRLRAGHCDRRDSPPPEPAPPAAPELRIYNQFMKGREPTFG
ncbi:hypothetical protein FISHEDRAFT_33985 [Fistulina hepatica ATCC 64428]|uniref:Myosin motor domain-containing protein n=1 Tax=Fistulina hepatica ATCC 64428 TaxID=1128425 RepID=A0A0D7AME7_9AGAR|nr:hypothetical protein FISHEDRAFT_33985 [Fistulina hepatica ATCC 64428]